MEKYGVEETRQDKVASDPDGAKTCPECGKTLESSDNTGVAKCPDHGTRPFER